MMTVRMLTLLLSAFVFASPAQAAEKALPFAKGERIVYTIKKMGVKGGDASLVFQGEEKIDGKDAYLILFFAKGAGFLDEEKIYVDRKTFLPIRVERNVDIKIWGSKKERITELYDHKKGEVKIVKVAGGKTTEQVIKKGKPMENLYGFIYRYRKDGKFTIGDTLQMDLPTMDVKLKITKKDKIKIGGAPEDVYFMESAPKKYMVWFDADSRKVPVRIDGAVGFGSTSMVLREYSGGR